MTPELRSVLEPQRQALRRSVGILGEQVEMLEEYAQRVANAESIYAAHRLTLSNDSYEALLTRVHDAEGVAQLTQQARDAEISLAAGIEDAREAGQGLTLPTPHSAVFDETIRP